jgi:hypothetical protein
VVVRSPPLVGIPKKISVFMSFRLTIRLTSPVEIKKTLLILIAMRQVD